MLNILLKLISKHYQTLSSVIKRYQAFKFNTDFL